MSAKHTPGPWIITDERIIDRGWWIGVLHPEWGPVTHAEVRSGCDEAAELGDMEANARLIAAAPDLLEAAAEAEWFLAHYAEYVASVPVDEMERHPYLPDLQEKVGMLRAAIAKARGTVPTLDKGDM